MEYPVYQRGERAGTVTVTGGPHGWRFEVCCTLDTTQVLRCFGLDGDSGEALRVGVLEPLDGALRLTRCLSYTEVGKEPPHSYVLRGSGQGEPVHSGDPLLDTAVQEGTVQAETAGGILRYRCVFDSQQPFALAFAAAACRIEQRNGQCVAIFEPGLPAG